MLLGLVIILWIFISNKKDNFTFTTNIDDNLG